MSQGIYTTATLDFAAYLIEKDVPLIRTVFTKGVMTFVFSAEPDVKSMETQWIGRRARIEDVRSYIETRQALIQKIQDARKAS